MPAPGAVLPALAWRHAGPGQGVPGAGAAPRLRLRVRGGQPTGQKGVDRTLGADRGDNGHAGGDLPPSLSGSQRQITGAQYPGLRRPVAGARDPDRQRGNHERAEAQRMVSQVA